MITKKYNEPEFKVVTAKTEDVLTASVFDAFASANGFINPDNAGEPSPQIGEWNMPIISI